MISMREELAFFKKSENRIQHPQTCTRCSWHTNKQKFAKNSVLELKKIIATQPIALCLDDGVELLISLVSYFKNSEKRRKDEKYKKSRT
jgi:hypothetical protein